MSAKKSGLGRGLEALIGPLAGRPAEEHVAAVEIATPGAGVVVALPVDRLVPGASQPRRQIDQEGIDELARSIAEQGLIAPLVVRKHPKKEGMFEIIAGERRWRAARKAGLESVPALVREIADRDALLLSLIENIQREDLSPIEQAAALSNLAQALELTQEELADRVGKQRSSVANLLRLLKLPKPVRDELQARRLSMGHGRALLGLDDMEQIVALAGRIVREDLSVRQTELLVRRLRAQAGSSRGAKPAPYAELTEQLRRSLGTKVVIRGSEGRGRLEIHYFSKEELQRIIDFIGP